MLTRPSPPMHIPLPWMPPALYTWAHPNRTIWSKMPGIKVFHVTALATLVLSSVLLSIAAQDTCTTTSQPNPIAQQYADTPTGTLNTTMAIVPIPLDTARRIVPAQHAILEDAYRALMPDFPEGMYPVLVTAGLDHDIQLAALSINVQDFQVSPSRDPKLQIHQSLTGIK